jgi:hypothetical protein
MHQKLQIRRGPRLPPPHLRLARHPLPIPHPTALLAPIDAPKTLAHTPDAGKPALAHALAAQPDDPRAGDTTARHREVQDSEAGERLGGRGGEAPERVAATRGRAGGVR